MTSCRFAMHLVVYFPVCRGQLCEAVGWFLARKRSLEVGVNSVGELASKPIVVHERLGTVCAFFAVVRFNTRDETPLIYGGFWPGVIGPLDALRFCQQLKPAASRISV